jgi:hypothetical protein
MAIITMMDESSIGTFQFRGTGDYGKHARDEWPPYAAVGPPRFNIKFEMFLPATVTIIVDGEVMLTGTYTTLTWQHDFPKETSDPALVPVRTVKVEVVNPQYVKLIQIYNCGMLHDAPRMTDFYNLETLVIEGGLNTYEGIKGPNLVTNWNPVGVRSLINLKKVVLRNTLYTKGQPFTIDFSGNSRVEFIELVNVNLENPVNPDGTLITDLSDPQRRPKGGIRVDNCPALKNLVLWWNPEFRFVDVTTCPNLEELDLDQTDMRFVDVTRNQKLKLLWLSYLNIPVPNLTNNPLLHYVSTDYNSFTRLDFLSNMVATGGRHNSGKLMTFQKAKDYVTHQSPTYHDNQIRLVDFRNTNLERMIEVNLSGNRIDRFLWPASKLTYFRAFKTGHGLLPENEGLWNWGNNYTTDPKNGQTMSSGMVHHFDFSKNRRGTGSTYGPYYLHFPFSNVASLKLMDIPFEVLQFTLQGNPLLSTIGNIDNLYTIGGNSNPSCVFYVHDCNFYNTVFNWGTHIRLQQMNVSNNNMSLPVIAANMQKIWDNKSLFPGGTKWFKISHAVITDKTLVAPSGFVLGGVDTDVTFSSDPLRKIREITYMLVNQCTTAAGTTKRYKWNITL